MMKLPIDHFDPSASLERRPKSKFDLGTLVIVSELYSRPRDSLSILYGKQHFTFKNYGEQGLVVNIKDSLLHSGTGKLRRYWYQVLLPTDIFWYTCDDLQRWNLRTFGESRRFWERHQKDKF